MKILKRLPKRPETQPLQANVRKDLFDKVKSVKEPYSWTEIIEACLEAYLEERSKNARS